MTRAELIEEKARELEETIALVVDRKAADRLLGPLRAALASPAPSTSTAEPWSDCNDRKCGGCAACRGLVRDGDFARAPSTSRDAARDDALEEAAREVETGHLDGDCDCLEFPCHALSLADRIRSLKGQPAAPADQSKETPHEP